MIFQEMEKLKQEHITMQKDIKSVLIAALILLIVKAKDRKKYKRWHNREKTANAYVRSLQRHLTQEDEE